MYLIKKKDLAANKFCWPLKVLYPITFCILLDFPIHIDTINMELPIVFFKGSQVVFSKLSSISVPEGCFYLIPLFHTGPESHELPRINKYLDLCLNRTQFVKILTDSHSP